ncbi:MAG TPA: TonB-dependent receptor [Sphingomicrobium sp.]|nr:TonB-dependent receptor [Sphingomicrobium sp.]
MLHPGAALAQETTDPAEETKPVSVQTDVNAAATQDPNDPNTIIVTGQRRALQTSAQRKRDADTVMDSITATDIGAFPDKSVAEALQRVPGITVNRFAATSDTAHFSAEPSGVIIRGLPQVRSEFNGRDTFSANSGRGLSWTDITPELLAGVDVYKNQTADLIEGGIAGSVNLRTRVPFDATGQLIQVGVRANYGDLSKKWTPDINGFYSNRFITGMGEFGVMANLAFSKVRTRSQGIQYGRAIIIDEGFGADGPDTAFFPYSINFLDNEYDRKRTGIAAAGQWRSLDRKLLVTAQYLRSVYKNVWEERSIGAFGIGPDLYGQNVRTRVPAFGGTGVIPVPAPGTPAFTFDEDGNFETGTPNRPGELWWGNPPGFDSSAPPAPGVNVGFGVNDQGEAMFNTCYSWATASLGCQYQANGQPAYAPGVGSGSRINQNKNMTQDAAINLKWAATDALRFNFDAQYVDSTIHNYDISIEMHSFANTMVDASGGLPRIEFGPPTNINQSAGGLANPNNWYLRSVMDHLEDSKGNELALRADGEYDLNTDWLDSLKFGARYADRKQEVQWSTYNWQNIANTWTDFGSCPHPYWNIDSPPSTDCGVDFNGYPAGFFEMAEFGAGFHGGTLGEFPFVPFEFLRDHRADEFSQELIGVGTFIPICQRNGQLGPDTTPTELPDSCFTPDEVADVREKTNAIYAMLKFGGDNALIGGMPFRGNIGLRYVRTKDISKGAFANARISSLNTSACPPVPLVPGGFTGTGTGSSVPGTVPFPNFCYLSPADISFADNSFFETTSSETHNNLLPSFNFRLDVAKNWMVRFAASKAMSRPDIGLLKNFERVSQSLPATATPSDPRWIRDSAGNVIGVTPSYTAQAFNPFLKPITAWQFDLSLEHYFGNAGQFSLALFHKKFYDYIQSATVNQDVTNNGVTRNVLLTIPLNADGAKIQGFEVAYNAFFDFLPQPFDGFGIQSNYTYVKNKGISNTNLGPPNVPTNTNPGNAGTSLSPGVLEGVSKHSFNLVGMYEKGPISARLAYNWRSKYLVTAVDCCVYLPVWQKASGFLDGSIRFRVNDSIELSAEGSNLLNTRTKLQTQVTDEESPEGKIILTPNGFFQNDRRFIVGVRWKMGK